MKKIAVILLLQIFPVYVFSQNSLFGSIGSKIPIEYMRNGSPLFTVEGTIVSREKLKEWKLETEYVDIQFRNDMNAPYGRPFGHDTIDLEFYGMTDMPNDFIHLCVDQIWKTGDYLISIPLSPWNLEKLKAVKRIRVDRKSSKESQQAILADKENKNRFIQEHPSLF